MDQYQQKLFERINYERQVRSGNQHFKLQNLRDLLKRLDQPHLSYPVIHVAGTKGKGSTSTMIGEILTAAGLKTGLYTSPHLESLHQRISIDGRWISNNDLERVLAELDPHIAAIDQLAANIAVAPQSSSPTPPPNTGVIAEAPASTAVGKTMTFFEIVTASAMHHFAQQKCDAVILEVGLGGRLDSTNVCQPEVAVITNISLDHTRQLGSTIQEIAFEKAGIIKDCIPVISGAEQPETIKVIESIASQRNTAVQFLGRDFETSVTSENPYTFDWHAVSQQTQPANNAVSKLRLQLPGQHQRKNAAIAIAAVKAFDSRMKNVSISENAIRKGLANVSLIGRNEQVSEAPRIILDIAHNDASVQALMATFQEELPDWHQFAKRTVVFATSRDKDHRKMLTRLMPCFDELIVTQFRINPRATPIAELQSQAAAIKGEFDLPTVIKTADTPKDAWESIQQSSNPHDFCCFTGSVFLIAEVRPLAKA